MTISLLAAYTQNEHIIGAQGKIPWKLPSERNYFKKICNNKFVIMGRKSFDEIGKPLSYCNLIVLTKNNGKKSLLQIQKDEPCPREARSSSCSVYEGRGCPELLSLVARYSTPLSTAVAKSRAKPKTLSEQKIFRMPDLTDSIISRPKMQEP